MLAVVDWVCLNVAIFCAILLNFVYTTFLHDLTIGWIKALVFGFDRAGFDAHFLRFIHMTLFEQDGVANKDDIHSVKEVFNIASMDMFLLACVILPLFMGAMHFYTAAINRNYRSKVQVLALPICFVPFFLFTNVDVAILTGFVLI